MLPLPVLIFLSMQCRKKISTKPLKGCGRRSNKIPKAFSYKRYKCATDGTLMFTLALGFKLILVLF